MALKAGKYTYLTENRPAFAGCGSVVGKKEHEGPMGAWFDEFCEDARFGQKSFEAAESKMQELAMRRALMKAGISAGEVDIVFAGDLLNQ